MDVTREELVELLDRERAALLIDVRPRERSDGGHIPKAHAVPLEDGNFEVGIDGLAEADHALPIVVVGQGPGSREAVEAAERLTRFGFSDVRIYAGGVDDWQGAALPVQSGVSAG